MVVGDTGSVEGIYAFIYCAKWRSGQVLPMPHSLTDSQMKDSATQLLIKYKSGALVTQFYAKKKVCLDVFKVCDSCFCSCSLVGELLHLFLDRVHSSEKL